jgi:AMP nucleosidase
MSRQAVAANSTCRCATLFDTPDLATTNDEIVNGAFEPAPGEPLPLAPFKAQRIDYSLAPLVALHGDQPGRISRTSCCSPTTSSTSTSSATMPATLMSEGEGDYEFFVEPGNLITPAGHGSPTEGVPRRLPQMPAYHLKRKDTGGITMVNIGVGPSNAKTITDHIAVLRPHAWLMLGHCAGLRNSPGARRLCAGPRLCARGPRA